jgi:ABC-type phosphate/phosphonate transport system ATPase subunit
MPNMPAQMQRVGIGRFITECKQIIAAREAQP